MKVLVPVKRVIDANVKIRVKTDHSDVEKTNIKMSINPFDEIAVEEAIRLQEAGTLSEIIAISIGSKQSQDTLRTALAMGADRAIHIQTDAKLHPLEIAKLLKAVTEKENVELVLLGKQAIDGDNGQTGQMLAALLDWPQGTFASKIEIDAGEVHLTREVDDGLETLKFALPAVITTDLRLNEPRYASMPKIMKAKKKPLEVFSPDELGIDITSKLKTIRIDEPAQREAGMLIANVTQLVEKLKNEEKVIP